MVHLYRKAQLLFFSEWKTLLISMAAIVIYAVGVVGFTIPYKFARPERHRHRERCSKYTLG